MDDKQREGLRYAARRLGKPYDQYLREQMEKLNTQATNPNFDIHYQTLFAERAEAIARELSCHDHPQE